MRKRSSLLLAAFFLLVTLFAAAGPPPAGAYRGELTVALTGEPPTMDPHVTTNFIGAMIWRWTFDSLTAFEAGTGKVIPWLAERWEVLGPKKVKFWLRKGVKFADGSPVNAEAVKYSIGRIMDPKNKSRAKPIFKAFDHIEIIDDYTFIWHSKEPDNGLFNRLTVRPAIMSPRTKDWDRSRISREPQGSGPYILKSWTKGLKMVFEANPNWWQNDKYPNRPKTVVLRPIKEAATRVKALEAGEVDVISQVPPQFVPQLRKNSKLDVKAVPSIRIMYLGFFQRNGGPFADRNVRLAVNYAIDADSISKTLLGGNSEPFGQLLHPWNFSGYNPDKKWYAYDLANAKAYMKKSGYPHGFKATLITTYGRVPADKATCEAIIGMVKKIGIVLTCQAQRFPLYRKNFQVYQKGLKKDPAMYYQGFGNTSGDPGVVLTATTSCKGVWSGYCDPKIDAALSKGLAASDPKEQQALLEKVTDMMKDQATHRIMFKLFDVTGFRRGLGFQPRHDEMVFPWEVAMP